MYFIRGLIRLELSDEDRAAIAEGLDDLTTKPRLHRRLMTVRFHDLSVPHWSIAHAPNLSDHMVTNCQKLPIGCLLGMIWSFTRIFVPSGSARQRYSVLGVTETHDLIS